MTASRYRVELETGKDQWTTIPVPEHTKIGWGENFSLGGKSPYGDAEVAAQSLYFCSTGLSPDAVNDIYLCGASFTTREIEPMILNEEERR